MKGKLKTLFIWAVAIIGLATLINVAVHRKPSRQVNFAAFRRDVAQSRIAAVWIDNNEITVQPRENGQRYVTLGVVDPELQQDLSDQGVVIHHGDEADSSWLLWILLPVLGLVALIYFLKKRGFGGVENILSLRKSRARLISDHRHVKFTDVGGCTEAKELLGDVIDFLKNPKRWTDAGARLPRGVLLEGPSGCGKTLLARAVAGETEAAFYLVSASEFVEMFVGVGAARVRDMFETAAKNAPAVVFIDELDAVGRRRGSGIGASHDEREQTLNQLLVCLDGFRDNDRVVVIAATNRPDILDQALLRPGRFDRRIRIPEPSLEARREILRIHTRNKTLAADVSLDELAARTAGFNGAQLENLANEAVLLAVRTAAANDGQPAVATRDDFDRVLQGATVKAKLFDKLDAVLVDSASQLAEPTGKTVVRLTVSDGQTVEGTVLWIDATFIKLRSVADGKEFLVAKKQLSRLEALDGTERAEAEDVVVDAWAAKRPDVA